MLKVMNFQSLLLLIVNLYFLSWDGASPMLEDGLEWVVLMVLRGIMLSCHHVGFIVEVGG